MFRQYGTLILVAEGLSCRYASELRELPFPTRALVKDGVLRGNVVSHSDLQGGCRVVGWISRDVAFFAHRRSVRSNDETILAAVDGCPFPGVW
jgi:hypothetical protein